MKLFFILSAIFLNIGLYRIFFLLIIISIPTMVFSEADETFRCKPGLITGIRYLDNGGLAIKLDSVDYENYTTMQSLINPLKYVFEYRLYIFLDKNSCTNSNRSFTEFSAFNSDQYT